MKKFGTKTAVIIVTSSCYYDPNDRTRLISPQRLFYEKQGATGCFLVEEHYTTLESDNVGKIVVQYEKDHHLPTALAKISSSGGAE